MTARLAQAEQDAAQLRLKRDREAQASRALLNAAQRQIDGLDEALRETRALVVAQSAAAVAVSAERAEYERTMNEERLLERCEYRAATRCLVDAAKQAWIEAGRLDAQQLERRAKQEEADLAQAKEGLAKFFDSQKPVPAASKPVQPQASELSANAVLIKLAGTVAGMVLASRRTAQPAPQSPAPSEPVQQPAQVDLRRRRYPRLTGAK